nr:hypothetical protein [Candidatus Sigynarchaeota archaeon]
MKSKKTSDRMPCDVDFQRKLKRVINEAEKEQTKVDEKQAMDEEERSSDTQYEVDLDKAFQIFDIAREFSQSKDFLIYLDFFHRFIPDLCDGNRVVIWKGDAGKISCKISVDEDGNIGCRCFRQRGLQQRTIDSCAFHSPVDMVNIMPEHLIKEMHDGLSVDSIFQMLLTSVSNRRTPLNSSSAAGLSDGSLGRSAPKRRGKFGNHDDPEVT